MGRCFRSRLRLQADVLCGEAGGGLRRPRPLVCVHQTRASFLQVVMAWMLEFLCVSAGLLFVVCGLVDRPGLHPMLAHGTIAAAL